MTLHYETSKRKIKTLKNITTPHYITQHHTTTGTPHVPLLSLQLSSGPTAPADSRIRRLLSSPTFPPLFHPLSPFFTPFSPTLFPSGIAVQDARGVRALPHQLRHHGGRRPHLPRGEVHQEGRFSFLVFVLRITFLNLFLGFL